MDNQNNKLYITISDERGASSGGIPTQEGGLKSPSQVQEQSNLGLRYAEHEMFHIVKNAAVQAINYQISNIGNFTGDYIRQRQVNEMRQAASGIVRVSMMTLAGAKYGPYGAVAGFVAGAASLVQEAVYSDISTRVEVAKTNFNINQLRERAGLNTQYDNSRGTEN